MPSASAFPSLGDLGWDAGWAAALAAGPDPTLTPGRVSRIDRGVSTVMTAGGTVRTAASADLALAVGDWVTLVAPPTSEPPSLAAILPRRRELRRVSEGPAPRPQVMAANIDTVLLVDAIDGPLRARHLERYVALAFQSGAVPAIVITKADLASPEQVRRQVAAVAEATSGVAVHVVSARSGEGVENLTRYLGRGCTAALIGLSGAGKSTLVNLLVGNRLLATGAVRRDGKGRHTTSHRELVVLPGGGLVIDTPGMRALSVSEASEGVAQVFADVERLSRQCAFGDCSHTAEGGCAVTAAVTAGRLSETRLASWRQLLSEAPRDEPELARLRVRERKRLKTTAKVSRARSRLVQPEPGPPP